MSQGMRGSEGAEASEVALPTVAAVAVPIEAPLPAELVERAGAGLPELREGRYVVRFARDERDVEDVQRLRFRIFNVELGEGFAASYTTGRDEDRYDKSCDHMMLIDTRTDSLVGTYRMQTAEMARAAHGFYCDEEFDLSGLPDELVERSIELGRACIEKDHRNGMALFALWRGLAAYLVARGKSNLFGCCSLTTQDPRAGEAMLRRLEKLGQISTEVHVEPRPAFACRSRAKRLPRAKVPRLFQTYLRYGALACGPPAIDREFQTIDFLIVLDADRLAPKMREMFFSGLPSAPGEAAT